MLSNEDQQLPLFKLDLSDQAIDQTDKEAASKDKVKLPESPFSKYIVYVDESGDHSLKTIDENYPLFVLALCVFDKRHYSEKVVSSLEKFKFNYFGHDQVVLHENEIRKEKGAFNIFRSKDEKLNFISELTEIIEKSNFILISCVIDKRSLKKQSEEDSNPYHIALGYCLDALYEFLEEKSQHSKKTHIVVECRGKKEDNELELEFRRICDGNNKQGKQLPFDILFSEKITMSSGLQLADLVARPIGLSIIRPQQTNRAFEVLKTKFYCDGGRQNVGTGYEGVGLSIFPTPESERPR